MTDRQWRERNRDKARASNRADYHRNKRKRNNTLYMRKYGISLDEKLDMADAQDNECTICDIQCDLVIDHDHETGKFRGLLCPNCNNGLGHFKDDPERMRRAADYIERSRVVQG